MTDEQIIAELHRLMRDAKAGDVYEVAAFDAFAQAHMRRFTPARLRKLRHHELAEFMQSRM